MRGQQGGAAAEGGLLHGRYRLTGLLGEGGMGRVWAARDEMLGRAVAIKEIAPERVSTAETGNLPERAIREARAIAGLLSALRAAHRAGILHRDVKPANVLLADDGRVVLTDFGLAAVAGDAGMTASGVVLGSPSYLAPECVMGPPHPGSDLWSLGATLFAAVEGWPPFVRSSPMATLAALMVDQVPVPVHAGPLTPALAALLEKDPSKRANADEAAGLLLEAVHSITPARTENASIRSSVAEPASPQDSARAPRTASARRRRRVVFASLLMAGSAIVVAACATALHATPSRHEDKQGLQRNKVARMAALPPDPRVSARPDAESDKHGLRPTTARGAPVRAGVPTPSGVAPTIARTASVKANARPSTAPATNAVAIHVTFEAESYTANNGTYDSHYANASGGAAVGHTAKGMWVGYANRSLAGVRTVTLRYAAAANGGGTNIELRANSATGPLLSAVILPATPTWNTYETVTAALSPTSSGPLYIDFTGPRAADIDTITFDS
ncbi:carbohydrate-binding protein [Actinoplanes sp. TBRC 11911]|uniref:protein kinase domain-containing protein n=1 Tax=Actinoplanes sp. TBRC 11911 TaxID=2729386 RepID=UPI00145DEDD7|nr:carbohydrate-binding protein [Actinoplanes sp. TBRC 11911]NMO50999.1 carbohydrate-binding protein [Actinoplanes sp. TBRC 11911]